MQNQLESKAYAGFFVRLIAYGIDMLIATLVVGMVKAPFSLAASSGADFLNNNFIFDYSFLDVLSYVGIAAYFVLLTYFAHTTVGKLLFHLEVSCDKEWTFVNILYRETIGRFLSSLMEIGYLAVIVQKEKQGFHDMLCDTHVVYKNMYERMEKTESPSVVTLDEMENRDEMSFGTGMEQSMERETIMEESAIQAGQASEPGTQPVIEQPLTAEQPETTIENAGHDTQEQSWTYYQPKHPEKEQKASAFEVTESHPIEAERKE